MEVLNLFDSKAEEEFILKTTKEITEAISAAKETKQPPLESLVEHVYFEVPEQLKEELAKIKQELN